MAESSGKSSDDNGYEAAQGVVFIAGLYEGVLPFPSKVFDWHPFLAFPTRLDDPWWWIVSGAVIVVALALLETLDRAKKRATG